MIANLISFILSIVIAVSFIQLFLFDVYPLIEVDKYTFINSVSFAFFFWAFSKLLLYIIPCGVGSSRFYGDTRLSIIKVKPYHFILFLTFSILFLLISFIGFYYKITISGIPSELQLPYKLNGATFYLARYILPMALIWMYLKYYQGNFYAEALLLFVFFGASLLGATRFTLLILFLPILLISFNNKKSKFYLLILIFLYMFSSVTLARYSIYGIIEENQIMNCGIGCLFELANPLSVYSFENFFDPILKILDRIESPNTLHYASDYCIECVGPLYEPFFRLVCQLCFPMDIDLHHMEWQGFLSPPGIVNNGGLLSVAISLSRVSFLYLLLYSFICAIIIHFLYLNIFGFANLYRARDSWIIPVIFLSGILFLSDPGGRMFLLIFMFFLFANFFKIIILLFRS